MSPKVAAQTPKSSGEKKKVSAKWVMAMAQLQGLDFITSGDAEPIANLLDPVREQLASAHQWLETLDPTPWPVLAG